MQQTRWQWRWRKKALLYSASQSRGERYGVSVTGIPSVIPLHRSAEQSLSSALGRSWAGPSGPWVVFGWPWRSALGGICRRAPTSAPRTTIFIFILSGLWVKTMINIKRNLDGETTSAYNYLYKTIFVPLAGDINGSLLFAIGHLIGFWLILYWMYRKKIQIKL